MACIDYGLRLAEDNAQHTALLTQLLQGMAVLNLKGITIVLDQLWPTVLIRHRHGLTGAFAFACHF